MGIGCDLTDLSIAIIGFAMGVFVMGMLLIAFAYFTYKDEE